MPGPGTFPAGRPAAELEAFGLRALDTVGARLALLFLVTALAGIPLAASPAGTVWTLLPCAAVLSCIVVIALVLVPGNATPWVLALTIAGPVTAVMLASPPAGVTGDQSRTLIAWVVAGLSSGVAAARGWSWGLAVSVPTVVTYLLAEHAHHDPVPALLFLGALTYFVGAVCTHALARRGFAATERALEAVAAAEAALQVAEQRWHARRQADRLLHNTVLATLTVLAHQGVGVAPGEIRAACARDLTALAGGDQSSATAVAAHSGKSPYHLNSGDTVKQVIEVIVARAAALGLELRTHVTSLKEQDVLLGEAALAALSDALAACLTNVRLHSGVDRFDLAVSVTGAALVVLVVDAGCGFDLAAVPEDRLGLRASVAEPVSALGGSVTVWSRPGEGTSVKLRLPLPAAAS
jgi:hypothetical protein